METLGMKELLMLHQYLCGIKNPSAKMKEAKQSIEDRLHHAVMTIKSIHDIKGT